MSDLNTEGLFVDDAGSKHLEVARAAAIRLIGVVLEREMAAGNPFRLNRSFFITDSRGNLLLEVPFAAAVQ